jgi:hypothetical protein
MGLEYVLKSMAIHGKYANIMLSHHLQLKVQCNFLIQFRDFLVVKFIAIIF